MLLNIHHYRYTLTINFSLQINDFCFPYSGNKGAPQVPIVRSQPQYCSLSLLSRDDSVSYKVLGGKSGNMIEKGMIKGFNNVADEDDEEGETEKLELALALAQIESLEANQGISETENQISNNEEENLKSIETVAPKVKKIKSEKKMANKSTASTPSAGWGVAIKSTGLSAPLPKKGKGLSLAKPIIMKKVVSSDSLSNAVTGNRGDEIITNRSFDDLKQIGRYARDLEEEQYGSSSIKSDNKSNAKQQQQQHQQQQQQLSFSIDDFPTLGSNASVLSANSRNVVSPYLMTGSSNMDTDSHEYGSSNSNSISNNNMKEYYDDSTGEDYQYSAPAVSPPPVLSVEQRNANIRAFVLETRLNKEREAAALTAGANSLLTFEKDSILSNSTDDHHRNHYDINSNGNDNGNSNDKKSNDKICSSSNWTKQGGVTVSDTFPPENLSSSSSYSAFINETDYPSLGGGNSKTSVITSASINGKNKGVKTAGNWSSSAISSPIIKTPADLLQAKKDKINQQKK